MARLGAGRRRAAAARQAKSSRSSSKAAKGEARLAPDLVYQLTQYDVALLRLEKALQAAKHADDENALGPGELESMVVPAQQRDFRIVPAPAGKSTSKRRAS